MEERRRLRRKSYQRNWIKAKRSRIRRKLERLQHQSSSSSRDVSCSSDTDDLPMLRVITSPPPSPITSEVSGTNRQQRSDTWLCNPSIFDGARMGTSLPLAGPPLDTSESQLQLVHNPAIPEDYPATSTHPSLFELWKVQLQLLEGQKKIMALLHEIQRNGVNKLTNSGPVMMEDLISEPFQTLPQFENFDQSLKDGTIKKTQIVSALKGAGGAGLAETIKNIMSSIATREVWQHFSLKGQKSRTGQKRGFINSTFYKYIRRACRYIHPGLIDPEVKIKLQVARFLTVSGSSYKSLCDKENEGTRVDSNGPAQEVMGTSDSD